MSMQADRFWSKRCPRAATIAALSIAAGSLVLAATPRAEHHAIKWSDPIQTDVDVSSPFLQPKGTHDRHAIRRCGEPEIAQDTLHPDILVMGCNTFGRLNYQSPAPASDLNWSYTDFTKSVVRAPNEYFISRDGGRSWEILRPNPMATKLITAGGDPLIAAGPQGQLYIGSDGEHYPVDGKDGPAIFQPAWRGGSVAPIENLGIVFSRSLDGGKTWSPAIVLPTGADRPFWAVDQSNGVIYDLSGCAVVSEVTKRDSFGCTSGSRNLAVSTDEGRTWSPSLQQFNTLLPTTALTPGHLHNIGGSEIVAARGVVASAAVRGSHEEGGFGPGGHALYFEYSTDEGRTFTRRPIPLAGLNSCVPRAVQGIAADPAQRGAFAILVTCSAAPRALHVYTTDDLGASWAHIATLAVVPPPDYQGRPSGFTVNRPWAAYSPTGELGVLWRENYGIPPKRPIATAQFGPQDVFLAIAPDGKTFGLPLRLNTAASPPADPRQWFGDDISNLILGRQYAYAVWGDWRSGELESWFRKVPLAAR